MLAVFAGYDFAVFALLLGFGRQGFINGIGQELVNGLVGGRGSLCLQLGDLLLLRFKLLFEFGLFVITAGSQGECSENKQCQAGFFHRFPL